jgi:hypothetical protein
VEINNPERNPDGTITTDAEREAAQKSAAEYFAELEARAKALEWYDGNGQPVNDAAREAVARGTDPWADEDATLNEPDDRDYTEWNRRKDEA